jgi:hypothetical protein
MVMVLVRPVPSLAVALSLKEPEVVGAVETLYSMVLFSKVKPVGKSPSALKVPFWHSYL